MQIEALYSLTLRMFSSREQDSYELILRINRGAIHVVNEFSLILEKT